MEKDTPYSYESNESRSSYVNFRQSYITFRARKVVSDEGEYYVMIKGSMLQED